MGKSATAAMFGDLGIPIYDADAAVHELYDVGGGAVAPIESAFPGVAVDGAISREALSQRVIGDGAALKKLEGIIHPLVGKAQMAWLSAQEDAGAEMVVLDIPLIFETGGAARVDVIVVVSAPAVVQRERVLARPGMTVEKFEAIFAKQTPDAQKRAGADFVVETDRGFDAARDQVKVIVDALAGRQGEVWTKRKLNG
jgi:dephospho-CoA kinase